MAISCTAADGIRFTSSFGSNPFTLSFRFRLANNTSSFELFSRSGLDIRARGDVGGDPLRADDGSNTVSTSTGFSANTWHQCGYAHAVGASAIYLDGAGKGTSALMGHDGLTSFSFGVSTCDLAEIGIWNVQLTDAEMAILGLGYSPLLVRPQSLQHYIPAVRPVKDVMRATTFSFSGNSVTDHPRVFNRRNRHSYFSAPASVVSVAAVNTLSMLSQSSLARLLASASNSIAFSQRSFPPRVVVSAANTLDLDQSERYNNIAENDLNIEQIAFLSRVNRSVEQTLRLKQLVRAKTGNIASGRYRR